MADLWWASWVLAAFGIATVFFAGRNKSQDYWRDQITKECMAAIAPMILPHPHDGKVEVSDVYEAIRTVRKGGNSGKRLWVRRKNEYNISTSTVHEQISTI